VTTRRHFKGKLPYTLKTTSKITVFDPPTHFQIEVVGDLTGTGKWTLAPDGKGKIHVRFDWIVHADRPLRRYLTPILLPIFPLEPQLVGGAGEGGTRAVRPPPVRRRANVDPAAVFVAAVYGEAVNRAK
jgi:hypothetical protein